MDWLRPAVVASAITLSLVSVGHAADVATLPPPASMSPPPPAVSEYTVRNTFNSDWYLRADIGERWGRLTGTEWSSGTVNSTADSLGKGVMYGVGAGFRRSWIRSDLTVDSGAAQTYKGSVLASDDVTAKIQSTSALLNIYADLGTWYRLTPYVGAGVGAARVTVSDFESTVAPPLSGSPSNSRWNMAWAAMVGAALTVSKNLQLDLGYRFLNVGNAETSDGAGGHATFKNIGAHELRVGLRWNLDDMPGGHWNLSDVTGNR